MTFPDIQDPKEFITSRLKYKNMKSYKRKEIISARNLDLHKIIKE